MCGSMVDIQSPTAEIENIEEKEEEEEEEEEEVEEEEKSQDKNIMACPIPLGGHNQVATG